MRNLFENYIEFKIVSYYYTKYLYCSVNKEENGMSVVGNEVGREVIIDQATATEGNYPPDNLLPFLSTNVTLLL